MLANFLSLDKHLHAFAVVMILARVAPCNYDVIGAVGALLFYDNNKNMDTRAWRAICYYLRLDARSARNLQLFVFSTCIWHALRILLKLAQKNAPGSSNSKKG